LYVAGFVVAAVVFIAAAVWRAAKETVSRATGSNQRRPGVPDGRSLIIPDIEAAVRYGFILDGFPRNRHQAEFFLERYDIDAVILIDVPDQVVLDRILNRQLCMKCGRDYNLLNQRPAASGLCDQCGGQLVAREDDTPEAMRSRLHQYRSTIDPVLVLFRVRLRKGDSLLAITMVNAVETAGQCGCDWC